MLVRFRNRSRNCISIAGVSFRSIRKRSRGPLRPTLPWNCSHSRGDAAYEVENYDVRPDWGSIRPNLMSEMSNFHLVFYCHNLAQSSHEIRFESYRDLKYIRVIERSP
jgi:hypothetical protein